MSKTRVFHLGDIISAMTGTLVSPRGIEGVYDILNFMTGESVYTHQLPRVSREAAPVLLRQHPQLESVDTATVNRDNWRGWLDAQVALFGETLPVAPMTADDHESIDPVSELAEKVHPDRIVVVKA